MANLDSNHWYQILVNETPKWSLWGGGLVNDGETGSAYFHRTEAEIPMNRWQFYVIDSKEPTYVLRSQEGGPDAFLGTSYSPEEAVSGHTIASMVRGDLADESVYWTIKPWGDGTYYMTNGANGTSWRLRKRARNNQVIMDSNTTAPQPRQRWSFNAIDNVFVNDEAYSTIDLPSTATMSSMTSSVTVPPNPSETNANPPKTTSSSDSSGLSTGAIAGIGAGAGGVALIALILVGLFCWRRRLQSREEKSWPYERHELAPEGENVKYEMCAGGAVKHEVGDTNAAKYELPASNDSVANYNAGDSSTVKYHHEMPVSHAEKAPTELPGSEVIPKRDDVPAY